MLIKGKIKVFLKIAIILPVIFTCTSLYAQEYQPLILDIPAVTYYEEGTTEYIVKKGDTLYSIGRVFDIDPGLIAALNDIKNPNLIVAGQKLLVPRFWEASHQVTKGETLWDIAGIYGVSPEQIIMANDIWYPDALPVGTVLSIPGVKAQVTISGNSSLKISSRQNNFMYLPTEGVLTSLFGRRGNEFHTGIDLANKEGTPIRAVQGGKVIFVGRRGNYGLTVIIDHQNGFKTLYGHNNRILVQKGQYVSGNQIIALMGNTGRSTGPHLHFEIYRQNKIVNPLNYLSRLSDF